MTTEPLNRRRPILPGQPVPVLLERPAATVVHAVARREQATLAAQRAYGPAADREDARWPPRPCVSSQDGRAGCRLMPDLPLRWPPRATPEADGRDTGSRPLATAITRRTRD